MKTRTVWLRHPSEDALEEYALLRLSEVESASLEEHLLACDSCQETLQDVDEFILSIRQTALAEQWAFTGETGAGQLEADPRRLAAAASGSHWAPIQAWLQDRLRGWLALTPGRAALAGAMALLCAVAVLHRAPNTTESPAAVTLTALRGGDAAHTAAAPAGRALTLAMDAADIPASTQCRVEIVNATGRTVWAGVTIAADGPLKLTVPEALGSGVYWVRVYTGGSEPVREFGLRLE